MNKFIQEEEPLGHTLLIKMKTDAIDEKYKRGDGGMLEERTASGIIVTQVKDDDLEREKAAVSFGYVVAIGPTSWKKVDDGTAWCEVGDLVTFRKYSGIDRHDIIEGSVCRYIMDIDVISRVKGVKDPCLS